jgi:hypothetical protein
MDPTSCISFDIFSGGVDFTCLIIIVVAWLLIIGVVIAVIYFFVVVLAKGTPKRIKQKEAISLQEATTEAVAIAYEMGADPTRPDYFLSPPNSLSRSMRIPGNLRNFSWMLGLLMVMCIAHPCVAQIEISNVRAQIPCSATRLACTGRQEQALSFDVSFNVPIKQLIAKEDTWMVAPFSSLDYAPGLQFCNPLKSGFDQCFLLNNGSGVGVSVEVGSFRYAYTMDPVPDYIFPGDYVSITTNNTGHVCSESIDPELIYQGETGCLAADCICPSGQNYSQIVYPLLPQCGIFSFRRVFPVPVTWVRVSITTLNRTHTATLPLASPGQMSHSNGFGVQLEVVGFDNIPRGKFNVPRLDGGIVIANWPQKIDYTFAGPDRARKNPNVSPVSEDWYYVNSAQRIDGYQNGLCGHNGVSSVQIYSDSSLCCTETSNFSTGACIPYPTPIDIITGSNGANSSTYFPPLPGGTVENAYWPYVDSDSQLHLLREVQPFELPNGISPRLTLRATIRDSLASISTRRILPGIDIRRPQCDYYHPDGIGVLRASLCNSAMHKAIVPLDAIFARVECSGEDGLNANFTTKLLTVRRVFQTARCAEIFFQYNFAEIPFKLNLTNSIPRLIDLFEMNCRVNATLQLENQILPVLMHVAEEIRCRLVMRDSFQPTHFVSPAVDIRDAPRAPCATDTDISCWLAQGTFTQHWLGPVFIGITLTLLIFTVTFFPIYTKKLESRTRKLGEKHSRISIDRLDPTLLSDVERSGVHYS